MNGNMIYTENDHTFVLLAYKESPHLEDCIVSLKKQTLQSNILISTSTPNPFIEKLAQEYKVALIINQDRGTMANDWNFAYSQARTKLVTLAHQDDIYLPHFLEKKLEDLNNAKLPLISFSNYAELRGGKVYNNSMPLKIKRTLLFPLRLKLFRPRKFVRRLILSFGCPICCPSVTYVKDNLPSAIFVKDFLCSPDWNAWIELSMHDGDFVYTNSPLLNLRIHSASTTSNSINNDIRGHEDFKMLCKSWPRPIAMIMSKMYKKAESYHQVKSKDIL